MSPPVLFHREVIRGDSAAPTLGAGGPRSVFIYSIWKRSLRAGEYVGGSSRLCTLATSEESPVRRRPRLGIGLSGGGGMGYRNSHSLDK
ncbi:hypothetical protein EVAR_12845_1 [Eumeta japonica]|uniref:Uncharacterized protein n=1 Tax=Eumeta variegata TaxID=151549 RepID=A0A4C1UC87_EUMVA|nr:hypothetical protein EVAR_12845_1 [Eumeta japonica]